MLGALPGIVRVVEAADEPQLRAGALQRYLAEAVWFPDRKTAASLEFEFGPNGANPRCTGWWTGGAALLPRQEPPSRIRLRGARMTA
jgi:hypothetical protein